MRRVTGRSLCPSVAPSHVLPAVRPSASAVRPPSQRSDDVVSSSPPRAVVRLSTLSTAGAMANSPRPRGPEGAAGGSGASAGEDPDPLPRKSGDADGGSTFLFTSHAALAALHVALRIGLANLAPLTDCDEVYNYWEPVHFLHYGSGMQTWEYAPQYALRTYAYLLPVAVLSKSYASVLSVLPPSAKLLLSTLVRPVGETAAATAASIASPDKILLFRLLRSTLACFAAAAELSLHSSLLRIVPRAPVLAHATLAALALSAGTFHASPALLPSSTVMILWTMSAAEQIRGDASRDERGMKKAIFWGFVASLGVGWPFCAVLFVTTGLHAVLFAAGPRMNNVKNVFILLVRTAFHALLIQGVVMAIDYKYYGKVLSPVLNIFEYNAGGGGDELYGVEPLSYYLKNLVLNFNYLAPLGLLGLPLLLIRSTFGIRRVGGGEEGTTEASIPFGGPSRGAIALVLSPMYLWLAIVFPRPHKEERFLFPVYPMLCLGAAVALLEMWDVQLSLYRRVTKRVVGRRAVACRNIFVALCLLPSFAISACRSVALSRHYSAPLALYEDLYRIAPHQEEGNDPGKDPALVCIGGEWYRFPSSYHLPPGYQLGFLKSSFGGQLPQPFTPEGSREESLAIQTGKFNDANEEEEDRYVDISSCAYVVELVPSVAPGENDQDDPECTKYMREDEGREWKRVASRPFLDAERTPSLHRILYVPFFSEGKAIYGSYEIYQPVER